MCTKIVNRVGVGWFSLLLLGLGLTVAAPIPARASNLDEEMKKAAFRIFAYAKDRGWKNIGVLKFRVKVGDEEESWQVGRLNSLMATRLENALILVNRLKSRNSPPLGVTRNASEAAIKTKGEIHWLEDQGREELLKLEYPLAWGKEKVKVDGFLTGTVHVKDKMTKIFVRIKAWEKGDVELKEIAQFETETDRVALVEMNQGFHIRSKGLKAGSDFDDLALESLAKENQQKETLDDLLSFKIYYDDKPVPIVKEDGQYKVETPGKDQTVRMEMIPKKKRLGVVLLVNGINTFRKEQYLLPKQYSSWILEEPGDTYTVEGFYPVKGPVEPFEILPEKKAMDFPLKDSTKRGLIELYVFEENVEQDQQKEKTNLKALAKVADNFEDAAERLFKAMEPVSKNLIVPGKPGAFKEIDLLTYDDPGWVAYREIAYIPRMEK